MNDLCVQQQAPEVLHLRVGAQVICLKNISRVPRSDGYGRVNLVNGQRGLVIGFKWDKGVSILSIISYSCNFTL
jgi:hypothetical protein